MGDMGDAFRAFAEHRKEYTRRVGISCPGCPLIQPKRIATILVPRARCKVCGTTYTVAFAARERAKLEAMTARAPLPEDP